MVDLEDPHHREVLGAPKGERIVARAKHDVLAHARGAGKVLLREARAAQRHQLRVHDRIQVARRVRRGALGGKDRQGVGDVAREEGVLLGGEELRGEKVVEDARRAVEGMMSPQVRREQGREAGPSAVHGETYLPKKQGTGRFYHDLHMTANHFAIIS
ncbi:hypothetical protein D3C86_1356510 [compost metagenome]